MNDLFAYAKQARDRGMAIAEDAQERDDPGFLDAALAVITDLARRQQFIHIDVGSVWARAKRQRIIRNAGHSSPCKSDPKKHGHEYPVYESLLFVGGAE